MAFLLLHESFSGLSLAGAGAFTASLAVAASPDSLLERVGMTLAETDDDELMSAGGTNATAAVEGGSM